MGDNELTIWLKMITQGADGASEAFHQRERARFKKTAAAQAEAAKEGLQNTKAADKEAADHRKQLNAMLTQSERQSTRERESSKRAEERQTAESRRALNRMLADSEKQAAQESASRAKATANAKKEAWNIEKMAMLQTHREKMAAWEKENKASELSAASVAKFGGAMAALGAGKQLLDVYVQYWDKIRRDAAEAADVTDKLRGSVRELAALMGNLGNTGAGIGAVSKLAAQTLQTPADAQQMLQAGLGVGELALDGKNAVMTRDDFNKFLASAGRMQTIEGGSADAYGSMAGQIVLNAKGKMSPEEGQAQLDRLYRIQQPGGFRTFTQAAEQQAKVAPLVQTGVLSQEEAAGLNSAFSVSSPGEAATRTQQFTRAVLSGRLRARGMKLDPGVDGEKTNEYLGGLGALKETNPLKVGGMVADDIAKQEATAKQKGQQFSAMDYLMTKGFANMEDREAILAFSGLRNSGRLDKITGAMTSKLDIGAPGQGVIDRRFNDRVAKDPFLQNRVGEVSDQLATAKQGAEEEPWVAAQRAAFAKLKADPNSGVTGEFKDFQGAGFWSKFSDSFGPNIHGKVEATAEQSLKAEAKRIGLNIPRDINIDAMGQGSTSSWDARRLAKEVSRAGGNPAAGAMDQLSKVADQLAASAQAQQRAAEALEKAVGKMKPNAAIPPPAMPAAPPVQRR